MFLFLPKWARAETTVAACGSRPVMAVRSGCGDLGGGPAQNKAVDLGGGNTPEKGYFVGRQNLGGYNLGYKGPKLVFKGVAAPKRSSASAVF